MPISSYNPNRPHRGLQRDARRLARRTGVTYQQALLQLSAGDTPLADRHPHVIFGIPEFDALTGHLPIAGLTLIHGKSGSGTSALLMIHAVRNAQRGARVLYLTLESTVEYATRKLAAVAAGTLWAELAPVSSLPAELDILGPRVVRTTADIGLLLEQFADSGQRPQLVCVAPLQMLDADKNLVDRKNITRNETLRQAQIAAELRELANRYQVRVSCSSQIGKMALPGIQPRLSGRDADRGLGTMFDDVVGVWRPEQRLGLTPYERDLHEGEWFCELQPRNDEDVVEPVALTAPWKRAPGVCEQGDRSSDRH